MEIENTADLIDLLIARINAEGGVLEAEPCLELTLNQFDI
jgi:hypothetical protein